VSKLVLGTRGSDLARAQTALVEKGLRVAHLELEIAMQIITTSGDERSGRSAEPIDRHAGRKGLFTSEIERALLDGEIDVAIHSAKDLPSEPTEGLEICAALPRAQVEDVLIAKEAGDLRSLGRGAAVATGSVRRQHQLRWLRDDLKTLDLRGNVPTRLRKLVGHPWDAIILARAGLVRLGFDCSEGSIVFEGTTLRTSPLPIEEFVPAGGQGIVALQVRSDDADTRRLLAPLNHAKTLLCLRAEREFLRLLQGDCGTPVGVLATIESERMRLHAAVFEEGRREPRTGASVENPMDRSPELVAELLFNFLYGSKT
jgi:hydroxymethylbilane synthase